MTFALEVTSAPSQPSAWIWMGIVLPRMKRYFTVRPALGSVSSLAPLRAND
jgi:hypothetical protein